VVQGEERLREELNQLMWDKILERVWTNNDWPRSIGQHSILLQLADSNTEKTSWEVLTWLSLDISQRSSENS
jgi:hypothetical protein